MRVIVCVHTYIHRCIFARYTCTYMHIHTYIHTYICTCMHTYIQTYRQTDRDIQTDRQTDRHTQIHRKVWMYGCMYVCMDGWIDGWMDACMHARMDILYIICITIHTNKSMQECMHTHMHMGALSYAPLQNVRKRDTTSFAKNMLACNVKDDSLDHSGSSETCSTMSLSSQDQFVESSIQPKLDPVYHIRARSHHQCESLQPCPRGYM